MMLSFVVSMFVVLGTFQAKFINGDLSSEFTNFAVLDEAATVTLYWSVDWDSKTVTFAVEALTTGWVGFGISAGRGQMIGADIVIGGVADDGKHYFMDCHATSYGEPTVDEKQDYDLISLTEIGNKTTMKFKRQFDTCDDGQDNKIEEGTSKVIYAYHPSDPRSPDYFPKHIKKGSRSLMLLNTGKSKPILPANLTFLDILNNQTKVPADETTYWCRVFEIPRMEREYHVVKVEPVVQKGHEGLVHHILLYECPDSFPTSFLNHSGFCYDETTPREIMECAGQSIVAAWAIGGGSFYYPEHVGLKIGTNDTSRYIVMETHYDNPDHKDDFVDSSGLRLWYTNETRMYDASTLYAGWDVTYQMVIPPKQSKWETVGYCPGACIEKGLENSPLEGQKVKVFAALLHTHLAGRQVRVKHIRYGYELKEIVFDNHYDFNFQEYQMLKEEIELWPRDELMVSCTYNTETLKDLTFGGFGTRDEMCLVFLMYYPRVNLKKCSSRDQVAFASVYLKHFWKGGANFLNITPETWSDRVTEDLRQAYKDENTRINVNCQGYNNQQILDGGSHSKPKIVYSYQPGNGPCVRKIHNEFEFEHEQSASGRDVSSSVMMALPTALIAALYRML